MERSTIQFSTLIPPLWPCIRRDTLRRTTALSTRKLKIEYSRLGEDAGVVGAIWLALENMFAVMD